MNPFNGNKVQIWVTNYVLADYGTGAVMGVPSGDQRDWMFATKYGIPKILTLQRKPIRTRTASSSIPRSSPAWRCMRP